MYKKVLVRVMLALLLVTVVSNAKGWRGEQGSEAGVSLMDLSEWQIWGTAEEIEGEGNNPELLIIGDTIGYDSDDIDDDGNIWGNPNEDDDVAVSVESFKSPVTLTFAGRVAATSKGYHRIGLMYANTNSVVDQTSGAWFGLDWEENPHLYAFVEGKGKQLLFDNEDNPIVATDGIVEGSFKIEWDGSVVTFYYNDQNVYQTDLVYDESKDIKVFIKTFDGPVSLIKIFVGNEEEDDGRRKGGFFGGKDNKKRWFFIGR